MPTIKDVLRTLETLLSLKQATVDEINALEEDKFLNPDQYQKVLKRYQAEEDSLRNEMVETLREYDRFPERHEAHFAKLEDFYRKAPDSEDRGFETSVFVMTKFPEADAPQSEELQKVIDTVQASILKRGYFPRIASETDHHEWLWANVEVFLLGCGRGVAIVEDKYRAELNPNVAMEWGWMRDMGRPVLFLREKDFGCDRANLSGLTVYDFDWLDPEPGVRAAITKFLPKRDK
jgi:hypothetical protein